MSEAAAEKRTLGESLAAFLERRTLAMLGLGFAAGLPNLLVFDTLSAWLNNEGVSLTVIGFFSLATLTYALKFIWAPVVDRVAIPGLTAWLGHRRSWMLVAQAAIIGGLWLISGSDPSESLVRMAILAVAVGFSGATQDIVIDAWRIEVAPVDRQGVMATAYQWGYRAAIMIAGAVPLILSDAFNWQVSYAVMTAMMFLGVGSALLAPREKAHEIRRTDFGDTPKRPVWDIGEWIVRLLLILLLAMLIGSGLTSSLAFPKYVLGLFGAGEAVFEQMDAMWAPTWVKVATVFVGLGGLLVACLPIAGFPTRPGVVLDDSFWGPLRDFFSRFAGMAAMILALICLYRLADFVLNIMTPFYQNLGFTNTEIAEVRKLFGVIVSMVGVFAGGLSVVRLGLIRTMVIGAFASPLSNIVFGWLALEGPDLWALFVAIGVDNFAAGYAGTALIAYMSSLTRVGFTATQYALFSSLYALPGKLVSSQSGRLVENSAQAADAGGPLSIFNGWFSGLPTRDECARAIAVRDQSVIDNPDLETAPLPSFCDQAAQLGVDTASVGAGYMTFFVYSTVIGVFAIALAFWIAPRHKRLIEENKRKAASAEPSAAEV